MIPTCPALPASIPGQQLTSISKLSGEADGKSGYRGGRATGQVVGHHPNHGSEHNCTATPRWFSSR